MSVAEKSLWSVRECAARLGISERTLHTITAPRGSLPSVKIGVRVLYRPETVEKWLAEQERDEIAEVSVEAGHMGDDWMVLT